MEEAIAACRIEMTVGDRQGDLAQRSESPDGSSFKPVPFRDRLFEIAYDVDRKPLGFELKLDDFDVGFEPGTEQATKFVSKVRLDRSGRGYQGQAATRSR